MIRSRSENRFVRTRSSAVLAFSMRRRSLERPADRNHGGVCTAARMCTRSSSASSSPAIEAARLASDCHSPARSIGAITRVACVGNAATLREPIDGGMARTGTVALLKTCSVVDPKNTFRIPLRPWDPMTSRSGRIRFAWRRISSAGLPSDTRSAISCRPSGLIGMARFTNRASSARVRSMKRRPPYDALPAATRRESWTNITVRLAVKCRAMATAARNAVRDCGEKSTGQRIDRNFTEPMLRPAVSCRIVGTRRIDVAQDSALRPSN